MQRFPKYTLQEFNKEDKFFPVNYAKLWKNKLSDKTIEFIKREDRITLEEYEKLRGNSFDWKTIYPMLNNKALISVVEHNLKNCTSVKRSSRYCTDLVYEEALINTLVPILLDRIEELEEKLNNR